MRVFACKCMWPHTLQHHVYLSQYHLLENHQHLFLPRYCHHHRLHREGQRSCPPRGVPEERKVRGFVFMLWIVCRFCSVVCVIYTVMPSLDFSARSMTVVIAVRWGVRQSGLTVDTAEYRLYLTGGRAERGEAKVAEHDGFLLLHCNNNYSFSFQKTETMCTRTCGLVNWLEKKKTFTGKLHTCSVSSQGHQWCQWGWGPVEHTLQQEGWRHHCRWCGPAPREYLTATAKDDQLCSFIL